MQKLWHCKDRYFESRAEAEKYREKNGIEERVEYAGNFRDIGADALLGRFAPWKNSER